MNITSKLQQFGEKLIKSQAIISLVLAIGSVAHILHSSLDLVLKLFYGEDSNMLLNRRDIALTMICIVAIIIIFLIVLFQYLKKRKLQNPLSYILSVLFSILIFMLLQVVLITVYAIYEILDVNKFILESFVASFFFFEVLLTLGVSNLFRKSSRRILLSLIYLASVFVIIIILLLLVPSSLLSSFIFIFCSLLISWYSGIIALNQFIKFFIFSTD